ncbi:hypothetical protein ACLB2K_072463 [Fragaria x ananassa]
MSINNFFVLWHPAKIENIVASDQNLSEISSELSIDKLFSISKLQVHRGIHRDKETFVLHSPFKLHKHRLSGQIVQERFGVNRIVYCELYLVMIIATSPLILPYIQLDGAVSFNIILFIEEAEKNLVQSTSVVSRVGGMIGPNSGGARQLYVGNLHTNIKEDDLGQVFGAVELVQLPIGMALEADFVPELLLAHLPPEILEPLGFRFVIAFGVKKSFFPVVVV